MSHVHAISEQHKQNYRKTECLGVLAPKMEEHESQLKRESAERMGQQEKLQESMDVLSESKDVLAKYKDVPFGSMDAPSGQLPHSCKQYQRIRCRFLDNVRQRKTRLRDRMYRLSGLRLEQ